MSRTIDEKVVEMRFDNSNFESNVRTSMSTLDKLKASIKNSESVVAFKSLNDVAKNLNLDKFVSGIDEVKAHISGLDMIANTVLSRVTNSVIDFGKKIFTAIPNQIKSGGLTRAANLEQAKFQLEGLKIAWSDISDDIDYAVDQTAYGMDSAAKAASQLAASGVQFGKTFGPKGSSPMAQALKGISGVAAMTNTSYDEIAHIFTSVAGQGKALLSQFNMIGQRGLNAKQAVVDYYNGIADGSIKASDSMKKLVQELSKGTKITEQDLLDFISKGKVNFEWFSQALHKAYGEHATEANKTYTGALANMKAAMSRIGADFYGPLRENMIGFFNESRKFFNAVRKLTTPLSEVFGVLSKKAFDGISAKIAEITSFLSKPGNKAVAMEGLYSILSAVYERLKVIGEAFLEVFGLDTQGGMKELLYNFAAFADALKPTKAELAILKEVFKGIFTAVKILGNALKVVAAILIKFGPALTPIITLVTVIVLLAKGVGFLHAQFAIVGQFIRPLIGLFGGLLKILLPLAGIIGAGLGIYLLVKNFHLIVDAVKSAHEAFKSWINDVVKPNIEAAFSNIKDKINEWWEGIKEAKDKIKDFFKEVKNGFKTKIKNAGDKLKDTFGDIGTKIKDWYEGLKYTHPLLQSILGIFKGAGSVVLSFFYKIGEWIKNIPNALSKIDFTKKFRDIGKSLEQFGQKIRDANIIDKLKAGLKSLGDTFSLLGEKIKDGGEKIKEVFTTLKDKFQEAIQKFTGGETFAKLKAFGDKLKEIFSNKDLLKFIGLLTGLAVAIGLVIANFEKIRSKMMALRLIMPSVASGFLSFLKILLPIAAVIAGGLGIYALIKNFDTVKKTVADLIDKFKEWFSTIAKPNISNFFTNIKDKITDWYNGLEKSHPLIYNILKVIKNLGQGAIEVFKKIGEFIKGIPQIIGQGSWTNIFSKIGDGLGSFVEKIKNFNIVERFQKGIENIKNAFAAIGYLFKNNPIAKGIGDAIDKVKNLFKNTDKMVSESHEVMDEFRTASDAMADGYHRMELGEDGMFHEVSVTADEATGSIKDFVKNIKVSDVAIAVVAGSLLALSIGIGRAGIGFGQMTSSVSNLINTFAIKKFFGVKIEKITSALTDFAIVIGVLAGSLFLLSQIEDQGKLKNAVISLGVLIALVGVLSILTEKINKNSKIFGTGSALLGMAAGLAVMVGSLYLLGSIDVNQDTWKKFALLAACLGVLVTVEIALSRLGGSRNLSKMSFNILSLGLAMFAMTKLINDIVAIQGDPDEVRAKIFGIIGIIGALALFAAACGNVRFGSGVGFIMIAIAIRFFANEIKQIAETIISNKDAIKNILKVVEEWKAGILILSAIIAGIIIALGIAGKGISQIGFGFLGFAAGFAIIGLSLKLITKIIEEAKTNDAIKMAMIFMAGVAVFFSVITGLTAYGKGFERGKYGLKIGGMMLMIASSFLIIGLALGIINRIVADSTNLVALYTAMAFIGVMMALMALIVHQVTKINGEVKLSPIITTILGLLGVLAALTVLTAYLKELDVNQLLTLTVVVGMVLGSIIGILAIINKVDKNTINNSLKPMAGLLIGLAGIMAAVALISIYGNPGNVSSIIAALVGLAAIIVAVGIVFALLNKNKNTNLSTPKLEKFTTLCLALIPLMAAFTAVSIVSSHTGNVAGIYAAGTMIGAIVTALAIAFRVIATTKIGSDKMPEKFADMAKSLIVIVGIFGAISAISNISGRVAGIYAAGTMLSGIVLAFAGAFRIIATTKIGSNSMPEKFAEAAKSLIPIIGIFGTVSAISNISGRVAGIYAAGTMISAIVLAFAGAFRLIAKTEIADKNTIKKFVDSVKAFIPIIGIFGAVGAISSITGNYAGIYAAMVGIAGVITAFSLVLWRLSQIKKIKVNTDKLKAVSEAMVIASLSMVAIAGAVALVSTSNFENLGWKAVALAGLFAEIAIALAAIPAIQKDTMIDTAQMMAIAAAFDFMAGAIFIISGALKLVENMPIERLDNLMNLFGTFMAIFSIISVIAGIIGGIPDGIGQLIMGAILAIMGALDMFGLYVLELGAALYLAGQGLDAMAMPLAVIVSLLDNIKGLMDWGMFGALVGLAGGLAALGLAGIVCIPGAIGLAMLGQALTGPLLIGLIGLSKITEEQFNKIAVGVQHLVDCMRPLNELSPILIAAAAAVFLFGIAVYAAGLGLEHGSIGMDAITNSLLKIASNKPMFKNMGLILSDIALGMTALGIAGFILNFGAGALVKAGEGLTSIINAISTNKIPPTAIHALLVSLADGLKMVAIVGFLLNGSYFALGATGLALIALGNGLKSLPTPEEFRSIIESIGKLYGITPYIVEVGQQFYNTAPAIRDMGSALVELANGLTTFTDQNDRIITTLKELQNIPSVLENSDLYTRMYNIGVNVVGKLEEGIKANIDNVKYAGEWMAQSILDGFESKIGTVKTALFAYGRQATMAVQAGTNVGSDIPEIFYAGEWMAKSIPDGFSSVFDNVKSTLKGFAESAVDTLIGGISGKGPEAASSNTSFVQQYIFNPLANGLNSVLEMVFGKGNAISNAVVSVKKAAAELDALTEERNTLNRQLKFDPFNKYGGTKELDKFTNKTKQRIKEIDIDTRALADDTNGWQKVTEAATKAVGDLGKELMDGVPAAEDFGEGLDNLGKSAGGAGEAMNSLSDTIANQMDLFSEFNMNTELTGEQLLNNMRSQIQGVSQWASNMQELARRGIAQGLYKKLMDLGPQGYDKVNAFMQMSAEQLAEANQLYATSLTLPGYAAKQVEGSYGYAAEMANAGFINGIDQQGWYQATYDAAAKAEAGSEERLEIMSPSHVMFRQGEYTMMGFNNGLKAQMPFVESTIRTIANKVITTMDTFFKDPANSVRMGQAIMQGFISGMNTLAMQGGFNGQTIATSLLSVFTYELGYGTLTEFVQGMLDFITQSFFPEDSENGYMYDLVQDIIDNIKLWFTENGEDFITYITDNLLTPITDEIDAKLGMEAMTTIGENIVNGLIQGIKNKQDDAVAAATELGEKVNAAFKSVEREASPSKVFYGFGRFLDMGLANGIRAYTNLPVDAVSRMGDTINSVAARVSAAVGDNMDMNPVIRPVLDTTNIADGIGIMNSMFGSAQARVSATATGYAESMRLKAAQLDISRNAQNKLNASYANALVEAVNSIGATDTNVNVVLAGDAAGVFKLVRTENSKFVKSTGYAPLAQRR